MTDKKTIYTFLAETGCCKRCVLRYVNETTNFDEPELELQQLCLENGAKKIKPNPCIICIDLLQNDMIDNMISKIDIQKILEYDCDTFVNFISFPSAILVRDHSVEILVKEKFPEFFQDHFIVPINKAWSLSIQNKLGSLLNRKFDKNSNLHIQFNTDYEADIQESSGILNLKEKKGKSIVSRSAIVEILSSVSCEDFKKYAAVPPELPSKSVTIENVTFKHDFIYIAGRYCKYSRSLFQTPWVTDDAIVMESVQDKIFEALNGTFNCSNMVFSTSGREDFDVRMLGRGRPFFIKICDPKLTKISFEKFRTIERIIGESKTIKVVDLQFVDRRLVNNIKTGEQFKQKMYRALCIVEHHEKLHSFIKKINEIDEMSLEQRTPLRVFHRRSADTRNKKIYNIQAKAIEGKKNLFELDLLTQAGTYVKEFVHGDLGRTQPSLAEIIGGPIDIIALDVLDIDLDFPPKIET